MIILWCKKHPEYMAKRKPTADCEACLHMWNMRWMPPHKIPGLEIHSSSISQSEFESMRWENPQL